MTGPTPPGTGVTSAATGATEGRVDVTGHTTVGPDVDATIDDDRTRRDGIASDQILAAPAAAMTISASPELLSRDHVFGDGRR